MGHFRNEHYSLPVKLLEDPSSTLMFQGLSEHNVETLQSHNMTYLSHSWGFSPEVYLTDPGLKENYRPTSTQVSEAGDEFVSSVEGIKYPFYGTQFHPEKSLLSFYPYHKFDHEAEAQ